MGVRHFPECRADLSLRNPSPLWRTAQGRLSTLLPGRKRWRSSVTTWTAYREAKGGYCLIYQTFLWELALARQRSRKANAIPMSVHVLRPFNRTDLARAAT